jgi:uncharacterized protein
MSEFSHTPRRFRFVAVAFEGGVALLALGLGWLLGTWPLDSFHWNWRDLGLGALAVLPPLGMLYACLRWPVGPLRELVQMVDDVLVPLFRDWSLLDFAAISLLAGLGEEMLFRGVVQAGAAEWLGPARGPWLALALSAVLFGLAHPLSATYALLAGLIGLYLGAIWLASGNLLVPVVAHAGYDFIALVLLTRIRRRGA